jgi:tetratricopeptide (TPR) repeat protein
MNLALVETQRLVAPVESHTMLPSAFRDFAAVPVIELEAQSEHQVEPNFVVGARAFAEAHPTSAAAFARLAQAEQVVGQTDAALTAARRALTLSLKDRDVPVTLAVTQVLIHSNRLEEAERALSRMPGPDQKILTARLAVQRGDLGAAFDGLADVETLEALNFRGWIALERHQFADAIRLIRRALSIGGATPNLLVNIAYAHAALGSRTKAIREALQGRELAPRNRVVGLNLMSYYVADRQFGLALAEVRRMRTDSPDDLQLAFAEADVHLVTNNLVKAERTLRQARTSSMWASADLSDRAELSANLAFLEWRLGRRPREDAKKVVIDELERSDYNALPISRLLPLLMHSANESRELARVIERLSERHPKDSLYALRTKLALLRSEFDSATKLAVDWATDEILNPQAASIAVFLLTDVAGDFDAAVKLSREALKRTGHSEALVNNAAYALTLAGELDAAKRLLPDDPGDSVYLNATWALVNILSGRIERGLAGYDRALELARQAPDPDLPELVAANKQLALWRASKQGLINPSDIRLILPSDWENRPALVLTGRVARREGIACSTE